MKRRPWMFGLAFGTLLCLVGSAQAQQNPTAQADLKDAQGRTVGTATFVQHPQGVMIRADLSGLPPGWHGFHIHETGKCEPPDFKSAGGHFAPEGHKHGFGKEGPHAGDLPNLYAGADGRIVIEILTDRIRLGDQAEAVAAGAADILDQDGAAIVLHAKADDYRTDPAGESGDRIACGVITAAGR